MSLRPSTLVRCSSVHRFHVFVQKTARTTRADRGSLREDESGCEPRWSASESLVHSGVDAVVWGHGSRAAFRL